MAKIIQSAWWIVYYKDQQWQARYLLIKRHALSKKIERVAPKGKIQHGESVEGAAMREVSEETGIPINQMKLKQKVGKTMLRNEHNQKGMMDKDTTYFVIEYSGNPDHVKIIDGEWYIGMYKRATLQEVLWLLYYEDMRELIRKSHFLIEQSSKNNSVKNEFINRL